MSKALAVSSAWLAEHKLSQTKLGWEGPRWRLQPELKALAAITHTVISKEEN